MAIDKKRTITRVASVSYDVGKLKSLYMHTTAAAAATVLAAGYYNDFRDVLTVNDIVIVSSVADGVGVPIIMKITAVPAAPANVTAVVADLAGGTVVVGDQVVAPLTSLALTDNTGGVASDVIADVPGAYAEATLAAQLSGIIRAVNRNTADVAAMRAGLVASGLFTA